MSRGVQTKEVYPMRSRRLSALVLAGLLTTSAAVAAPAPRDRDTGADRPTIGRFVDGIVKKLPPVVRRLFGVTTNEEMATPPKP
jgi:hypothetical protein